MKWNRIVAIMTKNYYITVGNVDKILEILFWPVVGLLMWGFTSVYLQGETRIASIVAFFIGAVILWFFLHRTQLDISTYILEDFYSRNVYHLFTSPLTAGELFTASVIFSLVKSLLTFGLLTGIALVLYSFNIFSLGIALVPLLAANLWIFGSAIGIFSSGIIARLGIQYEFVAWGIAFGLQPVSAVFYPLSTLAPYPGFYHLALALPTTYVFEGMRAAATGTIPWNYIGIAFALNLVFLVLCYFTFVKLLEGSRKSGFLATQI